MIEAVTIFKKYKEEFPNQYVVLKDIELKDIDVCVEERNDVIYIYVFHVDYFENIDDSNVIYAIPLQKFYDTFTYEIDGNNPHSNNEYTSRFKTEQECRDFLKNMGIKATM